MRAGIISQGFSHFTAIIIEAIHTLHSYKRHSIPILESLFLHYRFSTKRDQNVCLARQRTAVGEIGNDVADMTVKEEQWLLITTDSRH